MNVPTNLNTNVGICIRRQKHRVSILPSDKLYPLAGKIFKEFFFDNSEKGFQKLYKNIKKYTPDIPAGKAAMDATIYYNEV